MVATAAPALAAVAAGAGLTLMLTGCGKTEEPPEEEAEEPILSLGGPEGETGLESATEAEVKVAPNDADVTPTVINDWLTAHGDKSQSEDTIVREINFLEGDLFQEREDFKDEFKLFMGFLPEWYSPEVIDLERFDYGGRTMVLDANAEDKNKVYMDSLGENGRYRVAVGPRVTNPSYEYGKIIDKPSTFGESKSDIVGETGPGIKLDLMLEELKNGVGTGNYVYVYAITGDVKGHTSEGETILVKKIEDKGILKSVDSDPIPVDGMGLFQTGISTRTKEVSKGNADGSMVEFMVPELFDDNGKPISLNTNGMGNYRLAKIIVYEEDQ